MRVVEINLSVCRSRSSNYETILLGKKNQKDSPQRQNIKTHFSEKKKGESD
jgi:hypothetical protein